FAAVMFLNRQSLFVWADRLAERLVNKQLEGNYTFESHYTWLFRKGFWDLHVYDNPLWMIGSLFAGNIILYCYGYICFLCRRYLKKTASAAVRPACMLLIVILARHDIPMLAVILGGCYGLVYKKCNKTLRMAGIAVCILLLVFNASLYFVRDFDFERFPRYYEWAGMAAALALMHLLFSCHILQSFFACKVLTALSGLSFAVYCIHYPVIGLVACPMIYFLWEKIPYIPLVMLTFVATAAAGILLSFVYNRLIERPCYLLTARLIAFLKAN
ncbi:MAG: hypothetical protein IJU95_08605, partial [Treponema sp.]|nr:hypothetical protein [Treponema sp.]